MVPGFVCFNWMHKSWVCLLCRLFCLRSCFQNNVEIHVAHIQSGLSQLGNLHAFAANNTNAVWGPASSSPHTQVHAHTRVCGPLILSFEMVLSPVPSIDWTKACMDVVDHLYTIWIWMSQRNDWAPSTWCCGEEGRMSHVFYPPILLYGNVCAPNWTQIGKILSIFYCHKFTSPNFQLLFIGSLCQTLILRVFIVHIYLFLSRCVWLWNNILLSLWSFPL